MDSKSSGTILISILVFILILDVCGSLSSKQQGGKHSNPHSLNQKQNMTPNLVSKQKDFPSTIENEGI